ncbi:unnamed protein product [Closterium sp. NIES-54]
MGLVSTHPYSKFSPPHNASHPTASSRSSPPLSPPTIPALFQVVSSPSIPDWLDGLYTCPCHLSCSFSRSPTLSPSPHALLFEGELPRDFPNHRSSREGGRPLLVQMDMEGHGGGEEHARTRDDGGGDNGTSATSATSASSASSGGNSGDRGSRVRADISVGYGAGADVQVTYAGQLEHADRNRHVSGVKRKSPPLIHAASRPSSWRERIGALMRRMAHSIGSRSNNMKEDEADVLDTYSMCQCVLIPSVCACMGSNKRAV